MYPDDCIQTYTSGWWTTDTARTIVRGRLVWALVPYAEMKPYRLVPIGRGTSPTQHASAEFRIETFRVGDPPRGITALPVAALPVRDGETLMVQRVKRRPALVVCTGGNVIPAGMRLGSSKWQYAPTITVAPYYGSQAAGARGGWPGEFVDRIRRCEYPQYMWDQLPLGEASILRLDHLFAIGADPANYQVTDHVLSSEALDLLDEWFSWLHTGELEPAGGLAYARAGIASL